MTSSPSLSLLRSDAADTAALHRLAALDSAEPLAGPVLVAAHGDRAVAALSLADGRVVADPFERSAGAVELLRLRAAQAGSVAPAGRRRGFGRSARLALG